MPVLARYLEDAGITRQVVVVPGDREADQLCQSLESLGVTSFILPSYGTAPYSPAPSRAELSGRRMSAYLRVQTEKSWCLIVPLRALLQKLASPREISRLTKSYRAGDRTEPDSIAKLLADWDFQRVPRVSSPGEFALRGEVVDVWLPGKGLPARLAFAYDHIEAIREFDPENQSSLGKLDNITFYPFSEILWNDSMRQTLYRRLAAEPGNRELLDNLGAFLAGDNQHFEGEEMYLPWALGPGGIDGNAGPGSGGNASESSTGSLGSVLDIVSPEVPVILVDYERLVSAEEALAKEADTLYRRRRQEAPVPKPQELYASFREILQTRQRLVPIRHLAAQPTPIVAGCELLPLQFATSGPRSFFGNITFLREELANLHQLGFDVFFLCDSDLQSQRMESILADAKGFQVEVAGLQSGFTLNDSKIVVVHESEVWGRKKRQVQSLARARSVSIDSFVDLEERDYVVHAKHGIGMYQGIQRILAGGTERDYIRVAFADDEIIFVPIEQVNLIQKYIGGQGGTPRLDKIGGKSWESRKERVRQRVQALAEHLVKLYSRRKRARGIPFPPDTEWQYEFESRFPFEETEDQLSCIAEVKADMESPRPMDRLICGDVGFGKTEIAMRAAFKAVTAGKQVAFLAPTTILAEQHHESLIERLKGFPVRVAMLSRFVPPAQQKKVLPAIAVGEVDIVVGTHRIIQKDVHYKDLGLIIVDEEQRFGVRDKERLKQLRVSVDSLALSATPIPRTLHMSLLKIRDMSLLKTAPLNRRPIETHVEAFSEETVVRAIRAELARGGQVFYLHNRVEDLDRVRVFLERLVPEAIMETAHGKMTATELEDIMHRFIHGGSQVLIATTIIENGINIPNVNTIIIDRADVYGVSQLYQLRGRVGRSDRLAYAYLLYPGETSLSEVAMKRLQVISDNTALGSGFKIALKDLEVRGAGNLLGAEQSGEIFSVGIDMYLKLLDEEIRRIIRAEAEAGRAAAIAAAAAGGAGPTVVANGVAAEPGKPAAAGSTAGNAAGNSSDSASDFGLPEIEDEEEVYLELEYSGFIPDDYISDSMEKMEVYKKIASVGSETEFELLKFEIIDRFGEYPDSLHSLLGIAELRILCKRLKITALRERRGVVEVEFGRLAGIRIERLLEMIQSGKGAVKLDPQRPNVIRLESSHIGLKEKSEFLKARLSQLIK